MPKVAYFTLQPENEADELIRCAPDGYEVTVYPADISDEKKASVVSDVDFLMLFPGKISEKVLRAAHGVKLIQLVSAGFDDIDTDLCAELDIPVANNGGTNAIDVAEHTVALILGAYRRLTELTRKTSANEWSGHQTGSNTYTIHGKTVGIIGFGHIGRQVARILRGFGAYLVYTDVNPGSHELEREVRVSRVSMTELLQSSDIVTLHVPLSEDTRHLIGRRELVFMKPTALLVNTCRGSVIDETALIRVLSERRILGAALDVLETEPPAEDNPLLTMENVLLTPHVAGVTRDTWRRRGEFIFRNMQRVWEGYPPVAAVKVES